MREMPAKQPAKAPRTAAREGALRDLHGALGALNAAADPSELARQVVEAAASKLGAAGARLWRVSEGQPTVWQEAGTLPPADENLARQALASRAGTSVVGAGGAQWACALGGDGQPVGVLEARGAGPLDAETRGVLDLFARFAGVALAHTEQRHAVQELSSIVEATKRLNSTLDLAELINIILQIATRQTGADRGTVFLVDQNTNEIWSLVGLGLEQHEIRLPTTKGIAGWVARQGQTINLKDAYQDSRFEPEVDRRTGYRTRTLLCLPIRNRDAEIVGVLQLLNKKDGCFTTADEGFLGALSDHVAIALEKAQLHRELLAKERVQRDLELARKIQRGLLPESPPEVAGFDVGAWSRPSQMIGGDYYDFVPLGPETLLMVVADVEGKGVASALVMSNLQATMRALVSHVHSIERIVTLVNEMILTDTRGGKYMTMFAGLLDQRHRAFHYVNAGHVPPLVVRASGETAYLREGGMVVGVFPAVVYDRGFFRLETGDILVFCTDGITEAMDVQQDEYGLERLAAAVHRERAAPAQQMVETVLAEVERYARGGTHEDDRVLIIIKVL